MKSKNFNNLTPAETERLSILMEELSESSQMIGKIFRHGYSSVNPLNTGAGSNRQRLEEEIGQVQHAIDWMIEVGDLNLENIRLSRTNKENTINEWLHHQTRS